MSARGSVKRDASGQWAYVFDRATPDGRRRQVRRRGFATRREATADMAKEAAKDTLGLYVDPAKITVGEYLTSRWLPSLAATVRPTTADTYRRLAAVHIIPALGALPVQKLDRATVSTWLGGLVAKGLSAKSIRNIHGVLAKALNDAVDLELVARNAAARPKGLPPARRPAPRAWTAEELRKFLGHTAADRLHPLWRLLATTGCRRGEALGLRWSDVDLDAGIITITRQRTIAGGRVVEGAPKTASGARTVSLDDGTVKVLRAWRSTQSAERLMMGAGWVDTGLVFTHPTGGGLWPQTVTAKLRTVAGELGLAPIGIHGLRHSAATNLIGAGVNPRVVQQRLGHAHVSVTLGLYTHVMPAHDRQAADLLATAIDSVTSL